MFPVCLTTTKAGHLKQSSVHWMAWGIMCVGRYLTAKISEFHSHKIECSLSDILEDNVPEKYYLSRKQAEKLLYKEKPTQGERIYSSKGLSCTLTCGSGVFVENSVVLDDDEKFAVAFVEPNGEIHIGRIRKLTPRECWKLQGFTDDQFDKAKATGLSDSRLYKMAGNAVTVKVISEIGKIIKKVNDKN